MENIQRVQTGGLSLFVQGEVRPEMRGGFMGDEVYTGVADNTIIVCVDAVVKNPRHGTIYLAKRASRPMLGQWWWFGGRRNKGETPLQGMRRKFAQEAGLHLPEKLFEFIGVFEYIWQEREQEPLGRGTHLIAHQFALDLTVSELAAIRANLAPSGEYDVAEGLEEFDRNRILAEGLHPAVLEVYNKIFPG